MANTKYLVIFLHALAVTSSDGAFRREFMERYCHVYEVKKVKKLRSLYTERRLKAEIREGKTRIAFGQIPHRSDEYFHGDNAFRVHKVIEDIKPNKLINKYQVLRTLREKKP